MIPANTKLAVSLSIEEIQAVAYLLDVAVKATGLQGAKAALPLIEKFESAVEKFNSKPIVETKSAEPV